MIEGLSTIKPDKDTVVVLTIKERLTAEQRVRIEKDIQSLFPDNKILILSSGMTIETILKEKIKNEFH